MNPEIKQMLEKHGYGVQVHHNSLSDSIIVRLPHRLQEPYVNNSNDTYVYVIGKENVMYSGENVVCPQYACRLFVMADIKRMCQALQFDSNYLDFFSDSDKINETEFFEKIWPRTAEKDNETLRKESKLKDILEKAINCIVPYDESFGFEAQQMGVGQGYGIIRSFQVGE